MLKSLVGTCNKLSSLSPSWRKQLLRDGRAEDLVNLDARVRGSLNKATEAFIRSVEIVHKVTKGTGIWSEEYLTKHTEETWREALNSFTQVCSVEFKEILDAIPNSDRAVNQAQAFMKKSLEGLSAAIRAVKTDDLNQTLMERSLVLDHLDAWDFKEVNHLFVGDQKASEEALAKMQLLAESTWLHLFCQNETCFTPFSWPRRPRSLDLVSFRPMAKTTAPCLGIETHNLRGLCDIGYMILKWKSSLSTTCESELRSLKDVLKQHPHPENICLVFLVSALVEAIEFSNDVTPLKKRADLTTAGKWAATSLKLMKKDWPSILQNKYDKALKETKEKESKEKEKSKEAATKAKSTKKDSRKKYS